MRAAAAARKRRERFKEKQAGSGLIWLVINTQLTRATTTVSGGVGEIRRKEREREDGSEVNDATA